jgi:hypothetical protein
MFLLGVRAGLWRLRAPFLSSHSPGSGVGSIVRLTSVDNAKSSPVTCMKPSLLSALCAASLVIQAHAQGLLPAHRISPDLANQAVAAVVAKCASEGCAETGVLVDAHGVQQAVLRGNLAGAHTLDGAFAKAYTSASFKTDTTALVERSKKGTGAG